MDRPAEAGGSTDSAATSTLGVEDEEAPQDTAALTSAGLVSELPEGSEEGSESASGEIEDGSRGEGAPPQEDAPEQPSRNELEQAGPSLSSGSDCSPLAPLVVKRGPGRPRKDGSSPIQRKKL